MNTTEANYKVSTHNGTLTIFNPNTGESRTFRIKTQKADAKFAPGERILSLLTGPDNTADFLGFGFVTEGGKVIVWRRYLGTQFERFGRFIENLADFQERHGIQVEWSAKCRKCNRELTDWESIQSGIGPVCADKE